MFRTPVPLTLFFSLTLGVSAQSGGGKGTFATDPASPGLLSPGTTPRSFYLSGKVMVDDGTLLTDSVVVQSKPAVMARLNPFCGPDTLPRKFIKAGFKNAFAPNYSDEKNNCFWRESVHIWRRSAAH